MIKGIGCDIAKIERIEKLMLDTRFAQKRFEELCGKQLHVSISHESDTAIAIAIVE